MLLCMRDLGVGGKKSVEEGKGRERTRLVDLFSGQSAGGGKTLAGWAGLTVQ